jgi:signal transduction histidine kinase
LLLRSSSVSKSAAGTAARRHPLGLSLTRQSFDSGREFAVSARGNGEGEWDPDRLTQVIQNILNNAVSYSPAQSPITVSSWGEDDWVSLSIQNQGEPIAAGKLPTIFEPLRRAVDATTRHTRSVGLGLYIVKQIVEAHGGTVAVSSTESDGTKMTVRLPRKA